MGESWEKDRFLGETNQSISGFLFGRRQDREHVTKWRKTEKYGGELGLKRGCAVGRTCFPAKNRCLEGVLELGEHVGRIHHEHVVRRRGTRQKVGHVGHELQIQLLIGNSANCETEKNFFFFRKVFFRSFFKILWSLLAKLILVAVTWKNCENVN